MPGPRAAVKPRRPVPADGARRPAVGPTPRAAITRRSAPGRRRQPTQDRALAEKLALRDGRGAAPFLARRHVVHHPGLGGDLGAGADGQMAGQAGLAAEGGEIADHGRARNAALRHQHAMAADDDVVGDLNQVVDLGSLADDRVAVGAAVDRRPGADLDVVLDDDAADLRHLEVPARPEREAEAVLADMDAGMDDDAVADQRADDVAWAPTAQSRPMRTPGPTTALGPISVPAPISAPGPITAPGSTTTPGSSRAAEWTKAAGETPVSPNAERGLAACG